MRRIALILSLVAVAMFSCHCDASNPLRKAKKGAREAPFVALKNYYVRNALTTQGVGVVFKHDFDRLFGKRKSDKLVLPPIVAPVDSAAVEASPVDTSLIRFSTKR